MVKVVGKGVPKKQRHRRFDYYDSLNSKLFFPMVTNSSTIPLHDHKLPLFLSHTPTHTLSFFAFYPCSRAHVFNTR